VRPTEADFGMRVDYGGDRHVADTSFLPNMLSTATMAFARAAWANMRRPVTSPQAHTPATLVCRKSEVFTPLAVKSTPNFSRPGLPPPARASGVEDAIGRSA